MSNDIIAGTGISNIATISGNVPMSSGTTTVWGTTSMNSQTIGYCPQVIERYAWGGFEFLLIAIGIAVLVGAGSAAYTVYRRWK